VDRDQAIQRLLDEAEIRRVLHRYCRGMDRSDAETMSSIYHDDAMDFHGSGTRLGKEFGAHAVARDRTSAKFATMHFMGETTFAWDGEDAVHTESYVRATHVAKLDENWKLELFLGRYLDRFERRDGGWLIAQRVTLRDFMGVIPIEPLMGDRPFQGIRGGDDASYRHLALELLELPRWP
jgi:hypothetical protein